MFILSPFTANTIFRTSTYFTEDKTETQSHQLTANSARGGNDKVNIET